MLRAMPEEVALVHVLALELAHGIELLRSRRTKKLARTSTRTHPEATTTKLHSHGVNLDLETADHARATWLHDYIHVHIQIQIHLTTRAGE